VARKPMSFLVTVTPPSGASASDMRNYIDEAVFHWKGSLDPADPMSDLDGATVSVRQIPSAKDRT
jgi:hypothetical protein